MTRDDILAFAIEREEEAARSYQAAADLVTDEAAKMTLEELVDEEKGHAHRLASLRGTLATDPLPRDEKSAALMAEGEGASPLAPDVDLGDVLRHAIDREVAASEMYEIFAHLVGGGAFADLLGALAEEERRHEAGFRRLLGALETTSS